MKKYYETLKIDEKASKASVKSGFINSLKQFKGNVMNDEVRPLVEAYIVLKDDSKRAEYDSMSDEEYGKKYPKRWKEEVSDLCDDIRSHVFLYGDAINKQESDALVQLLISVGMFAVGLLVTIISFKAAAARRGGSYVVFYGLILVGFFRTIKWLSEYSDAKACAKEHKKNPEKMWDSLWLD